MKIELLSIEPINDDQKRTLIKELERMLNRSDMKEYLELKQVPNRTKLFKALRYSRPRNMWRLPQEERVKILDEEEKTEKAAMEELIDNVNAEDLLKFYCSKYQLDRISYLFYSHQLPIVGTFKIYSNTTHAPQKPQVIEEQNEPEMVENDFIQFGS